MYKVRKRNTTKIECNNSVVGELIEQKVQRIIETNEPIKDGVEMIYTARSEGVLPQYNIKTDRFEIALEAMDKIAMTARANRDRTIKPMEIEKEVNKVENTENNSETTE